jgi:hypothetical protein
MGIVLKPHMEQMNTDGLNLVRIDYNAGNIPESVQDTKPVIYLRGDQYCCVLGPNPESGISGCGPTTGEALTNFDLRYKERLKNPISGDAVSEYIQHRHI